MRIKTPVSFLRPVRTGSPGAVFKSLECFILEELAKTATPK
jgi:hypothetical protein